MKGMPARSLRDGCPMPSTANGQDGHRAGIIMSADIVQAACRVLVAPQVEQLQVHGQPEQETQLLHPQIGLNQQPAPRPRVGRLHQPFQHVQRRRLDAIAQQELLTARKPFHGRHQPQEKLVHCLKRRTRCPRSGTGHSSLGSAQKSRKIQSLKSPGHAKAGRKGPIAGRHCDADGQAEDARRIIPGAATKNAAFTPFCCPCHSIARSISVADMKTVIDQFPRISQHIMQ